MLTQQEIVWRELLAKADQGQRRFDNLAALAADLDMPVSTVHAALRRPVSMGAILLHPAGGGRVVDPTRLLWLWAGARRLDKDLLVSASSAVPAAEVERQLLEEGAVLGGFGAVVTRAGGGAISDYDTVVGYIGPGLALPTLPRSAGEIRVLLLQGDRLITKYGTVVPRAQAYTDLFNLPGWPAARFVEAMSREMLANTS